MSDILQNVPDKPKLPPTGDLANQILSGGNPRGETAGCPTGLSEPQEATADQGKSNEEHKFKPEVEELKGSPITGRAR